MSVKSTRALEHDCMMKSNYHSSNFTKCTDKRYALDDRVLLTQETFNAETYLKLSRKVRYGFPSHLFLPSCPGTISTRASPGRNRLLLNAFHFLKKFNYASSYRACDFWLDIERFSMPCKGTSSRLSGKHIENHRRGN